MRQLIGKIPVTGKVIEEVYLTEQVRCRECQKTVPIGVEVVAMRAEEGGWGGLRGSNP